MTFQGMPLIMNKMGKDVYPKDSINHKDHPDHDKPGFLVRAVGQGYYGLALREPGDVFRIAYARHFADASEPANSKVHGGLGWMEKVDGPVQKRHGPAKAGVGKRPPGPDLSERDQKMAQVDKLAAESAEEDRERAQAEEADVI